MAFGLTPKFSKTKTASNYSPKQLLSIAFEAINRLDWEIVYASKSGIAAFAKIGTFKSQHEVKVTLSNDCVLLHSESLGSELFDLNRNKKLVEALEDKIDFLCSTQANINLSVLEENYLSKVDPTDDLLDPNHSQNKDAGFLSLLTPSAGYTITPILLYVNLAVYLMMIFGGVHFLNPSPENLILFGGNLRPLILDGEIWRLLTACFVHIGIFHLIMNMYALIYVGVLLEPIMGSTRYLIVYICTGIIASVSSIWWHDFTVSAGASGAIFGLYGVFLALLSTNLIDKATRKAFLTSILIFVGYNLLYGMKDGIDNAAHLGGLVSGLVLGYLFYFGVKNRSKTQTIIGIIAVIAVTVTTAGITLSQLLKVENQGKYTSYMDEETIKLFEQKMDKFTQMEAMALEVYNVPESASNARLKKAIKDRGIYYWNENIKVINEIESMRITSMLHEQNVLLLRYCNLRIKSYSTLYRAVDEGFETHQDSLTFYNLEIEKILNQLNGSTPKEG